jgi:hypothetical protein
VKPKKRNTRDLSFENSSKSTPFKADNISAKFSGTSISKIEPSRNEYFEEKIEDPSRIVNPKQRQNKQILKPGTNIPEFEPSGNRHFDEMSDPGSLAVNSKIRKPSDLNFENSIALLPVKGEYVSSRLFGTCSSKIEPLRKRRFEEICDQDPSRTLNPKQKKICDLNLKFSLNFELKISLNLQDKGKRQKYVIHVIASL